MRRPSKKLALLGLAVLALSGCYSMEIDVTAMHPSVAMTGVQAQAQSLGQFEIRTTGSWLLWGLVPLSDPNVQDALDREISRANGTGVTSVEITTQQTFMDGLLSALTLGLYGQRSTMVRGTVVR